MQPTQLSMNRILRAPREKVFAAWTDPALLMQWWGPGPVTCPQAEVDLRPGGAYRLANLGEDGSIIWITGVFERVEAPRKLVYTWILDGDSRQPTLVTVEFRDHRLGTELVLTHERFTDPAARDMHLEGWGACIDKLERLLAGG